MKDLISRQMLLEYIHGEPVGRLLCDKYNLDGLIKQFPSAQPERTVYENMSDEQFEKWLYEHGICHPDIHESIPCSAVPLLIDNAINELLPQEHTEERTETHACDLIDRRSAIDALNKLDVSDGVGISSVACDLQEKAIRSIENLPSAQPYTDEEIQKMQDIEQAQLDKIRELAYQDGKADAMAKIIHCKDCKWSDWYDAADGHRYCHCMETGASGRTADDFCSYAECEEVSE